MLLYVYLVYNFYFYLKQKRTVLERATRLLGTVRVASNVAFNAGSSQHGKHLLASVASNWVTAANFSIPSFTYLIKKNYKIKTFNKNVERLQMLIQENDSLPEYILNNLIEKIYFVN